MSRSQPLRGSLAWVLGSGGLLGSRVARLLPVELPGCETWTPGVRPYSWNDAARLVVELGRDAARFAEAVRAVGTPWLVLWCAGAGGVGTPRDALLGETAALRALLGQLEATLGLSSTPGELVLCSSAGGVSGDASLPITETSATRPISEYGRNKLAQEQLVREWRSRSPRASCLIARISNLYGPGQNLGRPQGLIGHISQHLVHRRPINVFVPLDTLRDYVLADDAARCILRCARRLRELSTPSSVTKIVAAERSHSIADVVGIFGRITKQPVRVVSMPRALRSEQPRRLSFRSRVWTDLSPRGTDLAAGLSSLHRHHLSLLQRGILPAPGAG